MTGRFDQTKSLVFVILLMFAVASVATPAFAQKGLWNKTKEGVQKGAEGVKKGAETVGEKTVEGAEAVGHETKKIITGDDDSKTYREKPSQVQRTTPGTTPSYTTAPSTSSSTTMRQSRRAKQLPRTGGELLLFAFAGGLSLAGAEVSRRLRRR